jgi:hypothetical protein
MNSQTQTFSLIGLAEAIHNHTGMEGSELEAFTFYVGAGFADVMGRKDIGDHFDARCKASWAKHKAAA